MVWPTNKPPRGGPARGAGYGGPAKGMPVQPKLSAANQPSPEAKSAGHADAKTARELALPLRAEMLAIIADIARDPTAPHQSRADAANKVLNRSDGTPAASVDVTSKGASIVTWEDDRA